jgi:hypothetical protein
MHLESTFALWMLYFVSRSMKVRDTYLPLATIAVDI